MLGENEIPFSIVMTKIDKLTKNELRKSQEAFKREISNYWDPLPEIILSSAEKKTGKDELLNRINEINQSL